MDLGNLVVHLMGDASQYTKMMDTVERKMMQTANSIQALGMKMSLAVTAPLAAIGTISVKSFGDFDDAMTKSLAIMNDITPELRDEMEDVATTMSKEGVTSATELAESYFFLASAGMDAQQSMSALSAVNDFAIAGAFDMATATDLATDAQSALGLTSKNAAKNLEGLTKVTDVLIKANTLANASAEQFAKSLTTKSAASLRILNKDIEEGVAVLAAFADQGVKGELAGERLSIVLRDLQNANIKNNKEWQTLGLNVFDVNEKMMPLVKIVKQLENHLEGLSDKQKKTTLSLLGFQERSVSAIQTLLGTSDKIEIYEQALRNAGGTTELVANRQMQSFNAQMKIMMNNVKMVYREIGEILTPYILTLNDYIKALTAQWEILNDMSKKWIVLISISIAALGPLLLTFAMMIKAMAVIAKGLKMVMNGFIRLAKVIAFPLAIILLIVGVAYTFRAIWKQNLHDVQGYWKAITIVVSHFWDKIKEMGGTFKKKFVDPLINGIKAVGDFLKTLGKGFIGFFGGVWNMAKDFASWMKEGPELGDVSGESILNSYIKGFNKTVKGTEELVDKIGDKAKELVGKAVEVGKKVGGAVALYGKATGQAIAETVGETTSVVKKQFEEDVAGIRSLITDVIDDFKVEDPTEGMFDGIKEGAEDAKIEVEGLNKAISNISKIGQFMISNKLIDYQALRGRISDTSIMPKVPKLDTLGVASRGFGLMGVNAQTMQLVQQGAETNRLLKEISRKDRGLK